MTSQTECLVFFRSQGQRKIGLIFPCLATNTVNYEMPSRVYCQTHLYARTHPYLHPHPLLPRSFLWAHSHSRLPERLGSAPATITWAGEEPCWPYYATVPFDLWLCLCASATLINIQAPSHNLTYTVLNTSHTTPSVSRASPPRIALGEST